MNMVMKMITGDKIKKLAIGLLTVFLIAGLGSYSKAQNLEGYLRMAAENSPELKASYNRYLASLERVPQVGALPDPELSVGFYLQDMATLMGDQRMNATLMQRFPWFGKLQAGKDEASLMAKANLQNFEAIKHELFYEVKATYFQLYLLHHHASLAEKNLALLESLERLALNKFKGGTPGAQGKMTDVLRIQSKVKEVETLIDQFEDNREVEKVKFNLLLNRPEDAQVHVDTAFLDRKLLFSKETVLDSILATNPQVKKLEAEGEAFQKKGEVARLEGMPNFGLGLSYMVNSSRQPAGSPESPMGYIPGGMGHNMVMPMVSVSLPIFRGKYKAAKRESELYWQATNYAKEDLHNSLKSSWEEQYRQIREAERSQQLYEDQVKLLRRTMDLMIADYSSSEGSFEELLTVQQQLLEFEMKMAEETVARLQAVARLESLMAKGL